MALLSREEIEDIRDRARGARATGESERLADDIDRLLKDLAAMATLVVIAAEDASQRGYQEVPRKVSQTKTVTTARGELEKIEATNAAHGAKVRAEARRLSRPMWRSVFREKHGKSGEQLAQMLRGIIEEMDKSQDRFIGVDSLAGRFAYEELRDSYEFAMREAREFSNAVHHVQYSERP